MKVMAEQKQAANKKQKVHLDSAPRNLEVNNIGDVTEVSPPNLKHERGQRGRRRQNKH